MNAKKILTDLFDIAKTIVIVVLVAFFIRYFIFQPFVVDGYSMEPNFYNNEYLLVNKLSYRLSEPKRGDVIVFQAPNNPQYDYIKRIIGLPGDEITIKEGIVYLNGSFLDEKYLEADTQTNLTNINKSTLKITLGEDEYFVMGDNRDHSSDSRQFGALSADHIIGKAWFNVYPLEYFGTIQSPKYSL